MSKSLFSRSTMIQVLVFILFGFSITSACNSNYKDLTKSITVQHLSLPKADYNVAVWLDNTHIVLEYAHDPTAKAYEEELGIYDLELQELQLFPFEKPEKCFTGRYGSMARLPNDSFGFIYNCFEQERTGPGRIYDTLYIWDIESKSLFSWHTYSDSFLAGKFSFAPDMTELVQEQPSLNSHLYRLKQNGEMTKLVSHFWRAGAPSWSPDGSTIAFTGTEIDPFIKSSIFTGQVELENTVFFPWDIYLMNTDGTDVQLLMSNIESAKDLKWSPNAEWLAFRGVYEGTPGIWILNVFSNQLVRVWSTETAYDWSPSGQQMIVMTHTVETDRLGRQNEYGQPLILDLPITSLETK